MRNLLDAFRITQTEKEMTAGIRDIMCSALGKEISEIASESLHLAA
jgi:hypothetical protein